MRLLAIVGSYRKGKTVDTLIDAAIKGARAGRENVEVEKIHLVDKNVKYCKNSWFAERTIQTSRLPNALLLMICRPFVQHSMKPTVSSLEHLLIWVMRQRL